MIIQTKEGLCKKCYSCIRGCPVKAIKVQNEQAYVIQENCIACGNCIKLCSQEAKEIEKGLAIEDAIKKKQKISCSSCPFVCFLLSRHASTTDCFCIEKIGVLTYLRGSIWSRNYHR